MRLTLIYRQLLITPQLKFAFKVANIDSKTNLLRWYAKDAGCRNVDGCRKAIVDMPSKPDPVCEKPCDKRREKKKGGFLHKIKLKVTEGGTNFGTPFRRLLCQKEVTGESDKKQQPKEKETMPAPIKENKKALVLSKTKPLPVITEPLPGTQVTILGVDTPLGQYVALLLKQCPCIKKLRLYEAKDTGSSNTSRDLCKIVQDLQHINTNCRVQAYSSTCNDLERSLQNADIVLMLDSGYVNAEMPLEKRFNYQAPIVKKYTDAIALECPKAFLVICASPIDCMVPLVAETLKETGWYDPRKLLGSMAGPEMRASTLVARALGLEPRYTRVPCIGGSEGESLVPLFSKAVEYFNFNRRNYKMLTTAVRSANLATVGSKQKNPDLSEAHAIAKLVASVANALLCKDMPLVTGFVETDSSQVISPAKYLAIEVLLDQRGIGKKFDVPSKLSDIELLTLMTALDSVKKNVNLASNWFMKAERSGSAAVKCWNWPSPYMENIGTCKHQM